MENCIFCRIVSGEIPALAVYEDAQTLAFMDVAGDADGHILVVPKKHCRSVLDADEETLCAVIRTVRKVSVHLTQACGYDGVNLLHAGGESAGQSVPHLHIHILPRKRGDGMDAWPKLEGAKEEIRTVYERIRMDKTAERGTEA